MKLCYTALVCATLLLALTGCGVTEMDMVKERGGDALLLLGSMIAVTISWSRNKSVGWAILHGVLGWLYVIYYALKREDDALPPAERQL